MILEATNLNIDSTWIEAFDILLIAAIISGILTGGLAILNALGLIQTNDPISENLSLISNIKT